MEFFFLVPLGRIISKIEYFYSNLPISKTLNIFYKKDEWKKIEESVNEAQNKLNDQIWKSELELNKNQTILDSINESMFAVDHFETILFSNKKFKQKFPNLSSSGEIIPKIWHYIDNQDFLEALKTIKKSKSKTTLRSLKIASQVGDEAYYDVSLIPFSLNQNESQYILVFFQDITEFKRLEQMRVDFIANMSHEMRTPLTSIMGYSQFLLSSSESLDKDRKNFLEKIFNNSERLSSLFNDLLKLSVIESQNLEKSEEIDIRDLVARIESDMLQLHPQRKTTITSSFKASTLWGDPRLIEQVLTNLIDNSIKYGRDVVNIELTLEEDNFQSHLIIKDDGPGIAPEHLNRIFERFYRVESSRESVRGTGLGLSIVKHIINKHNGKIDVQSSEHGTTFALSLPKKDTLAPQR